MSESQKGLPIKFAFSLDEDQKEAKRAILDSDITIVTSRAGAGKSSVTAMAALDLVFKHGFTKILLTRPTVEASRTLGYLPGILSEKVAPYVEAFIDTLHTVYKHPDKINKMIEQEVIENFPLQFVRGKNVKDKTLLVIDESQLTTKKEMEALLTRLTPGSKCIISGDLKQKDGIFDGLDFALELSRNIPEIKHVELTSNHRSGIVGKILDYIYGL